MPTNLETINQLTELTQERRWVVWKFLPNPGKPKPKKMPYKPGTQRPAESDNPATWGTYEQALRAYQRGGYEGLGYELDGSGLTGVDLDACRDPKSGAVEPWAEKIVADLSTYAEISPSQAGIKLLARGTLPEGRREKGLEGGREIGLYDSGRFFTLTGDMYNGCGLDIRERTAELTALHAELFPAIVVHAQQPPGALALDDTRILDLLRSANNGPKFDALWRGDWQADYPSHSEADLALCSLITFYSQDEAQVDRLFQASGLYTDKWERPDYSRRTIARALERTEFYSAPAPEEAEEPAPDDSPAPAEKPLAVKVKKRRKGKGARTIEEHERGLQELGYTIRLNRVTGKLEANGKPLEDLTHNDLRARMHDLGYLNAQHFGDVLCHLGLKNDYHPVRDYLAMCTAQYDGKPVIASLAERFTDVTEPHKLFATWLRRWLIGAVAKAMRGGDVHNSMLVLDGPQLLGKSYFASWLASGLPGYFTRGRIDPENKDCLVRYAENFVWETAELGATTRRADIDALKEFITSETVTVRPPYGKYDQKRPALASLIGTINNSGGFLADMTGNRRFLVARISKIDWAYSENVSLAGVWGEAVKAYQAGEVWLPTPKELVQSEENNENYMLPNPLEGYLDRYFDVDPADHTTWESTGDIVSTLTNMGYKASNARALSMEVAQTLSKIGCEKYRKDTLHGRIWGYLGIRRRAVQPATSRKSGDRNDDD